MTTYFSGMDNSYRDQADHVEVRKRLQSYSSHTLVLYYISSERGSEAEASFIDQIPLTVSQEDIQFYPEFGSQDFELFKDNQVVWTGEIPPDEMIVVAYSILQTGIDNFEYPPEIVSVRDLEAEAESEELIWRGTTVEPVSKNVVDTSTTLSQGDDDDLLETLRGVLSHDVGNLLLVAQGQLQLAQKTDDADHIQEAEDVLTHLDELITDLVSLCKIGHQVTDLEPVDLEAVARQAWQDVPASNATLEVDTTATIVADESSLRQLLQNLFRNAIDHGGDDVTIRVGPLDDQGFYVADDGSGIPESQRDQIFEAGYSTDEQSGLGLSIVERLAESHGWSIDVVESSTGGARFEFTT